MEVTFGYTAEFKRQIKRQRKKYASLQSDFNELLAELSENPFAGVDLGDGVRKVRMAINPREKGKSGGARVITYSIDEKAEVPHIDFLTIYDRCF